MIKTYLAIRKELKRAEKLHPNWPKDIVHQIAIVNEESGEALQAVLNQVYHGGSRHKVYTELIQTGAMVFRFLKNYRRVK